MDLVVVFEHCMYSTVWQFNVQCDVCAEDKGTVQALRCFLTLTGDRHTGPSRGTQSLQGEARPSIRGEVKVEYFEPGEPTLLWWFHLPVSFLLFL